MKKSFFLVLLLTLILLSVFLLAQKSNKNKSNVTSDWVTIQIDSAGFSVLMPGEHEYNTQKHQTEVGEIEEYSYSCEKNNLLYQVSYNDYPETLINIKKIKGILDGAINGISGQGKIISQKEITLDGNPGSEVVFTVNNSGFEVDIKSRIFIVKNRMYQVMAIAEKNKIPEEDFEKFFNSFRILKK